MNVCRIVFFPGHQLSRLLFAAMIGLTIFAGAVALAQRPSRRAEPTRSSSSVHAAQVGEAASLLKLGKLDEAERILRGVISSTPRNPDAHNLLGIILDQRGNPEEAEREYRTALRLAPKTISALANLGVLLVHTKRFEEAIKTFESVLRLAPAHPQATINLGLLYTSRGQHEPAVQLLKRGLNLQPDSYDILYNLGISLYTLNQLDEAAVSLQSAASLATNRAEPLYFLGLVAYKRNQHEIARELWERAITLDRNHAAANFMLGELLAQGKDYSTAKTYYEKALAQDAAKAVYHIRLGGAYLYLHDFNRAFETFKIASERFPRVPEIHYFLSIAARSKGESDLALVALKKALAISPNYADALALFGAILLDRGDLIEAERLFRKALLTNSNNYNANYNLGRLLVKQQKFHEALPLLQWAGSLLPENSDVHYQLFLTYSRLDRKADAHRELEIFKRLSEDKK